jgi:hypothetical protein
MKKAAEHIHGYTCGTAKVAASPVSMRELDELKISVGFTEQCQRYQRLAGEVPADQTKQKSSSTGAATSSPASQTSPGTRARPRETRAGNLSFEGSGGYRGRDDPRIWNAFMGCSISGKILGADIVLVHSGANESVFHGGHHGRRSGNIVNGGRQIGNEPSEHRLVKVTGLAVPRAF